MDVQSIRARAKHLDESAHLLACASPAISRHLRSQLHTLATDYNLNLSDAQKREACGACGNIMTPGWTSRTYLDIGRSKRSLKRNASRRSDTGNLWSKEQTEEAAAKAVCYECLICNRVTRQALPAPRRASQKKQEQIPPPSKLVDTASRDPNAAHITAESGLGPPLSSFSNASSRRRAKARKQSGLQALLAKKKEESLGGGFATGFGLDLMDLMKTS